MDITHHAENWLRTRDLNPPAAAYETAPHPGYPQGCKKARCPVTASGLKALRGLRGRSAGGRSQFFAMHAGRYSSSNEDGREVVPVGVQLWTMTFCAAYHQSPGQSPRPARSYGRLHCKKGCRLSELSRRFGRYWLQTFSCRDYSNDFGPGLLHRLGPDQLHSLRWGGLKIQCGQPARWPAQRSVVFREGSAIHRRKGWNSCGRRLLAVVGFRGGAHRWQNFVFKPQRMALWDAVAPLRYCCWRYPKCFRHFLSVAEVLEGICFGHAHKLTILNFLSKHIYVPKVQDA